MGFPVCPGTVQENRGALERYNGTEFDLDIQNWFAYLFWAILRQMCAASDKTSSRESDLRMILFRRRMGVSGAIQFGSLCRKDSEILLVWVRAKYGIRKFQHNLESSRVHDEPQMKKMSEEQIEAFRLKLLREEEARQEEDGVYHYRRS